MSSISIPLQGLFSITSGSFLESSEFKFISSVKCRPWTRWRILQILMNVVHGGYLVPFWIFLYASNDYIHQTLHWASTLTLFSLIIVKFFLKLLLSRKKSLIPLLKSAPLPMCNNLHCQCCTETHFAELWPCTREIWNTV